MSVPGSAGGRPSNSGPGSGAGLSQWLSWQETLHPNAIDLGLDRLGRTLDGLGWRRPACPVITVGGTNGKGSSVAMTSAILGAAGYRVGTFTSPHLLRYNERITIAGREVSDASLIAAFERIDAARGNDTLTFFEFNTLAALLAFETAGPDAIVLEVGMGGRLDAVNIVDADVAVISSVALDHCDWLGTDVETIGREKAGILRAGRPAIFGSRNMPASVAAAARELGSDLRCLGQDFDWRRDDAGWTWRGREHRFDSLPVPALAGEIQFDNASAVLAALECVADRLPVPRAAVEEGLRTVHVPGRFQVVPGPVQWILDVAHNPAAAGTLARQLAARPHSGRTIAVCGILGDKDIEGIASEVRDCLDAWIVVGLTSVRALSVDALAERLRAAGAHDVSTAADVEAGCRAASANAQKGDRIVVFGSFLTVGPAIEWLESHRAGFAPSLA
jgi:dihydrofolate synthase / folylpolyglutamate synthase